MTFFVFFYDKFIDWKYLEKTIATRYFLNIFWNIYYLKKLVVLNTNKEDDNDQTHNILRSNKHWSDYFNITASVQSLSNFSWVSSTWTLDILLLLQVWYTQDPLFFNIKILYEVGYSHKLAKSEVVHKIFSIHWAY